MISFMLVKYIDFAVMLLLLVNTIIGVVHEYKAGKAVEILKSKLKVKVKALRDSERVDVSADQIVPDDIVKLSMSDIVPDDGIILEGSAALDKSALTGESLPVEKSINDKVLAGTTVVRGEALVKIVATGVRTRFGKTAGLTSRHVRYPWTHSLARRCVFRITGIREAEWLRLFHSIDPASYPSFLA